LQALVVDAGCILALSVEVAELLDLSGGHGLKSGGSRAPDERTIPHRRRMIRQRVGQLTVCNNRRVARAAGAAR
jgi:hypothetical protein